MNTLHIKNLEIWGIHGKTGDEPEISQPFGLDITVEYDFRKAVESDDLEKAIDYKIIEKISKKVIEGERKILLETLADEIAVLVLAETKAESVSLTLSKLRPKTSGIPSVTLRKTRILEDKSPTVKLLGIDKNGVDALFSKDSDGILHLKRVLYKILDKDRLESWYKEKWQTFQKKEEKYIENNQEVSLVYDGVFGEMTGSNQQEVALHNLYYKIRNEIEKYSEIPFKKGDRLETKMIKYPVSNLGVGAHRDLSSNVNCVILFNLYGTTTFYTASDKKRGNEKAYLVEPGDVVIMRGPRNETENNLRPIHYVLDISEERLVFVCREIESAQEEVINKGNWMGF